jgi:DNA-binding GntR family transcriptional regulator
VSSTGAAAHLDRASAVPLYRQIERILRDELAAAESAVQQRITESELIGRFQVSRHTVRQALALLASAGLIDRRQRRGTYPVAPIEQPLSGVYSFVRSLRELGVPYHSTVLSARVVTSQDGVHSQLGASQLLRLRRLHFLAGEPLIAETIWLPSASVPGIEACDLSGSVYELLQARFHIRVTSARESIRPVVLDGRQGKLLGVEKGFPAFFVERLSSGRGGPVEVRHSLIRGDRYLYSVQLRSPQGIESRRANSA